MFHYIGALPSILSNDVFVVNESYSGNCSTWLSNPGPTPTPTVTTSVTNSPTTTQTPSVTPTKSITPQTPTPTNGLRTVVVKSCCTTKLGGNTVSQQLVNTSNNAQVDDVIRIQNSCYVITEILRVVISDLDFYPVAFVHVEGENTCTICLNDDETVPCPTYTPTPTPSITSTFTLTPTTTNTYTPTNTNTVTNTLTITKTVTVTPSLTVSPTTTITPTVTITNTPTNRPGSLLPKTSI